MATRGASMPRCRSPRGSVSSAAVGGFGQNGKRVLYVVACIGVLVPVAASSPGSASTAQATSSTSPNVVLILTDDQRWDSVDQMPQLDAAPEWARFSNAFVDEPQCCPSRASTLTGQYPQHTGVETLRDGKDMNDKRTIATMLHGAGYRTGFYGKYLNGYPFG